MEKIIFIPLILLTFIPALRGQGENNIWILSEGLGLDFNSGKPEPIFAGNMYVRHGQVVTACNSLGNLLFYSDGEVVRNRDHEVMPEGNNLNGYSFAGFQGILVVPFISDPDKYFIFTVETPFGGSMEYSVLDMSLEGGRGDIISSEKRILLADDIGPGIIAVQGACNDIWVIVHMRGTSDFLAYNVSTNGVNIIPVISSVGNSSFGNATKLMAAPNSRRIAVRYAQLFVEVLDFDPATGLVSNAIFLDNLPEANGGVLGFCFSPSSSFLYIGADLIEDGNVSSEILQYDLNQGNALLVKNSQSSVGLSRYKIRDMQIGPEGIIYLASQKYIGTISNPNAPGIACNFVDSSLYFDELYQGQEFQNLIILPDSSTILPREILPPDTALCNGEVIQLNATTDEVNYLWSNGSADSILHASESGQYWVEIYRDNCRVRDTVLISFHDSPLPNLGPDLSLCPGERIILDPMVPEGEILWGDTLISPTLPINEAGTYVVRVFKEGCWGMDTITIDYIEALDLLQNDTFFCPGDLLILDVEIPGKQIIWQDGTQGPLTVTSQGVYSVTLQEENCPISDTIFVIEDDDCLQDCQQFIPNVFSPNGDGANDEFLIEFDCIPEKYHLMIYNRWGGVVFESTDHLAPWTASDELPEGVYVYFLRFKTGTQVRGEIRTGNITLLR